MEVKLSKRPASPTLIRNYLRYQKEVAKKVNPKFRGVAVAEMEKHVNSIQRKIVLAWLFEREDELGMLSSNDLTPEELAALNVWIDPMKNDGVWTHSLYFAHEFRGVAYLACRQFSYADSVRIKDLPDDMMDAMMKDLKDGYIKRRPSNEK